MADFAEFFSHSILASHPPLYLHEICIQILHGTGERDDTDLIQNFTEVLQRVTGNREERSFNDGVCEFALIIIGMIKIINMQSISKRRKPISSGSSEYPTPLMNMRSTASSGHRHSPLPTPPKSDISFLSDGLTINNVTIASPPEEVTGFDATGFDFSAWEDIVPVELITPMDSGRYNESGQTLQAEDSAEKTAKNAGSLGRSHLLETFDFP